MPSRTMPSTRLALLAAAGALAAAGFDADAPLVPVNATGGGRALQAAALGVCADVRFAGRATLVAGQYHTCALSVAGGVACWGSNSRGQTAVPASVTARRQVAVAAGYEFTCALSAGGGVACWGYNDRGQTAVPASVATSGQVAVVAGSSHACALSAGGGVTCWGWSAYSQTRVPVTVAASSQIAMSAGFYHTCALSAAGGVACWGGGDEGQTRVPSHVATSGHIAVTAGDWHTCALSVAGGVACWGWNPSGQSIVPASAASSGQLAVAAGPSMTCALSAAGWLACWGENGDGRLSIPASVATSGQVAVVIGAHAHKCALSTDGGVACWGGFGSDEDGRTAVPANFTDSGIALPCRPAALLVPTPFGTAFSTKTRSRSVTPSGSVTPSATPSPGRGPLLAFHFEGDYADATGNTDGLVAVNGQPFVPGARGALAARFSAAAGTYLTSQRGVPALPTGGTSRSVVAWVRVEQLVSNIPLVMWGLPPAGVSPWNHLSALFVWENVGGVGFLGYGADVWHPMPANLVDGSWHHLGYTFNGTLMSVYYDGAVVAHGSVTLDTWPNTNLTLCVTWVDSQLAPFTGAIDEVLIYDRALSTAEVQALAVPPSTTPTSTATGTPTAAATGTSSGTTTGTPSFTATGTPSSSATGTPTASATGTSSGTATGTSTSTATGTPSSSATGTPTFTATGTSSGTAMATATPSLTGTGSYTVRPSGSPTKTSKSTMSSTRIGSPMPTTSQTTSGTAVSTASTTDTLSGSLTVGASSSTTGSASPSKSVTPSSSAASSTSYTPSLSHTDKASTSLTRTPARTRSITGSPSGTASASAPEAESPSANFTAGSSPMGTSTASPSASSTPAAIEPAVVLFGMTMPIPDVHVFAASPALGLSLRLGLACAVGLPLEQVQLNSSTDSAGVTLFFNETDNLGSGPCDAHPRRLLGSQTVGSAAPYPVHKLQWVTSLSEIAPGRAILFHDALAGLRDPRIRMRAGTRRLQAVESGVYVRIVIPATSSSGASISDVTEALHDSASNLVTALNSLQFSEQLGDMSPLLESLSLSGFIDAYSASTGVDPGVLASLLTVSEPVVDVPSLTRTNTQSPWGTFTGMPSAATTGTPSATASGMPVTISSAASTTAISTRSTTRSPPPQPSDAPGIITTVAGNGVTGFSGDGGSGTSARLTWPSGVSVDGGGNLFIADSVNHRIRRLAAGSGVITTVAGNGVGGFSGDGGPATSASLYYPHGVVADGGGNLYIADANHRIRLVTVGTGVITTVAGKGVAGFSGDGGPATSASLMPRGLDVDAGGNLLIADTLNHRVRRLTAGTGVITTVAGIGVAGFSGDGGPSTSASLAEPSGVAVDEGGNLLIADRSNNRIRRVDAGTGVMSTVAGNGAGGFSGDGGPATAASFLWPTSVAVDGDGNVFIADFWNHRIRRLSARTGVITTVAGTGENGFSGDGGPGTSATLANPNGVAVDSGGNLLVADYENHRVRRVAVGSPSPSVGSPASTSPTLSATETASPEPRLTGTPPLVSYYAQVVIGASVGGLALLCLLIGCACVPFIRQRAKFHTNPPGLPEGDQPSQVESLNDAVPEEASDPPFQVECNDAVATPPQLGVLVDAGDPLAPSHTDISCSHVATMAKPEVV